MLLVRFSQGLCLFGLVGLFYYAVGGDSSAKTDYRISADGPAADAHTSGLPDGAAKYKAALDAAQLKVSKEAPNPLSGFAPGAGHEGRLELDRIYASGFPVSNITYNATKKLLNSPLITDDERIALARIVGRHYAPNDPIGLNSEVLLDLRSLFLSSNADVARSAIFTLSSFGYLPGTPTLLANAHDRKVLNSDDYYGELAYNLARAPRTELPQMLDVILAGKSSHARDVISSMISDEQLKPREIDGDSIGKLSRFLADTEPSFPAPIGVFGLTDAVSYSYWVKSKGAVDGALLGIDSDAAIIKILSLPGTDPRKVLAFLSVPGAEKILEAAYMGSPAYALYQSAASYARQFSMVPTTSDAFVEIQSKLPSARK